MLFWLIYKNYRSIIKIIILYINNHCFGNIGIAQTVRKAPYLDALGRCLSIYSDFPLGASDWIVDAQDQLPSRPLRLEDLRLQLLDRQGYLPSDGQGLATVDVLHPLRTIGHVVHSPLLRITLPHHGRGIDIVTLVVDLHVSIVQVLGVVDPSGNDAELEVENIAPEPGLSALRA